MVELLSREYEISYSHIDNRGIAKPSFLWSMMQDAATVHAEALGLGPAALGVVWVLSRIKATLTRPLLPYERVRCETWCPGFKGPSWYRCFAFYIDDVQVGEAQSMWVTLEPSTHRILRPTALPAAQGCLSCTSGELFAPLPRLSCDNVRLHHIHPVQYSDLDINNHVNNVRVVELISDALDLQKQPGFVSSLQVNYTAETAFGEQVSLLCGTVDGARYIRGEAEGKPHFEALASLSPPAAKGGSLNDRDHRTGCARHPHGVHAPESHSLCGKAHHGDRQAQGVQPLRHPSR